jgi:hypothetical protein
MDADNLFVTGSKKYFFDFRIGRTVCYTYKETTLKSFNVVDYYLKGLIPRLTLGFVIDYLDFSSFLRASAFCPVLTLNTVFFIRSDSGKNFRPP